MPVRLKILLASLVIINVGFSLACDGEGDTDGYDPDDDTCVEQHLGTLCIVNQTEARALVTINGEVLCTIVEDESCCRELSSRGGDYAWEVKTDGWIQEGADAAPECEVRYIDVWAP